VKLSGEDLLRYSNNGESVGLRKNVRIITILLKPRLHDTTCCQGGCQSRLTTGLTTGWMFVYTIQPVVKQVVQPVWQPVVSCKRGLRNDVTITTITQSLPHIVVENQLAWIQYEEITLLNSRKT